MFMFMSTLCLCFMLVLCFMFMVRPALAPLSRGRLVANRARIG